MKLVTFTHGGRTRIGELDGDTVYTLAWSDNMRHMLRRGVIAQRAYERFPAEAVKLEAPLIPGKIIAVGLNYADHARETGKEPPAEPLLFSKFPTSVIGSGDTIRWRTSVTNQVDYEGELAVVIGKRGKDISEDKALDHVFGYTIANDVSARDLQFGKDTLWTRAKGLDTFCPLGPAIITKSDIPDPHALSLKTELNGEVMQDGSTSDMVFRIPFLISYISRMFTLEPGDLLLTGTPAGVGRAKTPPRFLGDGDVVSITIDGIGTLTNTCHPMED
jgi:5-carboxymethyl-2-hydroxymuconate isomerase